MPPDFSARSCICLSYLSSVMNEGRRNIFPVTGRRPFSIDSWRFNVPFSETRFRKLYEERAKWPLNESYVDVGIPFLCHAQRRTEGNGEEGQCKNRRRASLKTKTRRMHRTALLLFIKMKSAGLGGRSVPPCHPCVNPVSYFIISFYVATVRFKRNR